MERERKRETDSDRKRQKDRQRQSERDREREKDDRLSHVYLFFAYLKSHKIIKDKIQLNLTYRYGNSIKFFEERAHYK